MERRKVELIDYVRGGCGLGIFLTAVYLQSKGYPCVGCAVPNCQLKKKIASSDDIRKVPSTTCPQCHSMMNKDKARMQYKKTHKEDQEHMATCRACGTDVHI